MSRFLSLVQMHVGEDGGEGVEAWEACESVKRDVVLNNAAVKDMYHGDLKNASIRIQTLCSSEKGTSGVFIKNACTIWELGCAKNASELKKRHGIQ